MNNKVLFGLVSAVALFVGVSGAQAGDAAAGEKVYAQCKACHSLEAGKKMVGPSLAGIVGKKAAGMEGFAYSDAMKNSGLTWDDASLAGYVADPKGKIPGNKMAFAGIKDPTKLDDLIAFLKTK
ncbi:MAG TPA: c-type cytochrome [Azospirillaceae bacterium]|nr:c-type cytochrome [Azospirillaceae bacterium]